MLDKGTIGVSIVVLRAHYILYSILLPAVFIFNIALVNNIVPESIGNAVVVITPQGTVPEQVILTISTNSGSATGE